MTLRQTFLKIIYPLWMFYNKLSGRSSKVLKIKTNLEIDNPISTKSNVIREPQQNPVISWLTDKTKNGWTNKQPSWNFSKWLVNEQGMLTHYFDPSISPLSEEVKEAIEEKTFS